jgi:hypothetical protein
MEVKLNYYEEIFNNISEPILLMENNQFIDMNISALNLFNVTSKSDIFLLHPSQLSPKHQPCGELSLIKSNKMIGICLEKNEHSFEWLSKTLDGATCRLPKRTHNLS